jgi:hypothetical protein
MKRKALFGFHSEGYRRTWQTIAEVNGWESDAVSTLEEMMEKMQAAAYDLYALDANLENAMSENIMPARRVYAEVRARVESGETRFLAVTGDYLALTACQDEGIPAVSKGDQRFDMNDYF